MTTSTTQKRKAIKVTEFQAQLLKAAINSAILRNIREDEANIAKGKLAMNFYESDNLRKVEADLYAIIAKF
jgi:hypothetical protein